MTRVTHALQLPWDLRTPPRCWCGLRTEDAGPADYVASPEHADCPRCIDRMRCAKADLARLPEAS